MPFIALAAGLAVAVIDRVIKYFVAVYLQPVGTVTVIDGLFNLTYVENRGVAFGWFTDMRWFFVVLTSVLLIIIIFYMFKKHPKSKLFYVSAALIVGGGVGNLIDRLLYGYVIDYLSLSFFSPICNFADYCITAGTVILVIYVLFFSDTGKKKKYKKDRRINDGV